jgi:hypothetical protein
MKRVSVLRVAYVMIGTTLSVFACSSDSNPTLPPGAPTRDGGGIGERGMPAMPDGAGFSNEDVVKDVVNVKDVADANDATTSGLDAAPPALVNVTILSVAASAQADGGASAVLPDPGKATNDGGASAAIVVDKSSRFAPVVRVEVESRGGDPLADLLSSVQAGLFAVNGGGQAASGTLNQIQYTIVPESDSRIYLFADTPLDVSKVAPDFYDLQIVATTAGGATGTASVRIFLDGGPNITFLQPADKAYVKGSITVTAMVLDDQSPVVSAGFSIGQSEIDPGAITSSGGQYSVTLDFSSYNPPLDGDQIVTVTAVDGNGITSLAARNFTIDNVGPTIKNTLPASGSLIGKIITIAANVDDPAGVMDSSVVAVVANGDIHFEVSLTKGTDGVYRAIFDTTQLPIYAIFPTVSFRAQDVLGNESSVGYLVSLDNTPPILDLDPPADMRLTRASDGACSWPFDPVGPDAIDDGSVVTQLFDIRARIEDRGNTPLTGTADWIPIADIDPASVNVLILDDTSLPLVVDTSDPPDGICDDINPDLVPSVSPQTSKDAQIVGMVPMPANAGVGNYTPQPDVSCSGADSTSPTAFCDTTYSPLKNQVMTYVLGYLPKLASPAIWTVAPIVADDLQCAGRQFDASNHLQDGWACVAVEASDKMGNKQVSRPLRICVVATPGSTACTAAGMGGADVVSVTLPSRSSGPVVVGTKAALLGSGGAAVKSGDAVAFSGVSPSIPYSGVSISFFSIISGALKCTLAAPCIVSPSPYTAVNGVHTVTPQGTGGTSFVLSDLSVTPAKLWLDNMDGTAPTLKGMVGLIVQKGAEVQVVTDQDGTSLDPAFTGGVMLLSNGLPPDSTSRRWIANSVQPSGFKLTGSSLAMVGTAVPTANMPNCTGTAIKQASGAPPVVDGTKPCAPWRSFVRNGSPDY